MSASSPISAAVRPPPPESRRWNSGALPRAAVIAGAAWFCFSPSFHGSWLWDDRGEIVDNPALRSASGLGRIWSGAAGLDYFPLKTTVEWLQWHLWGAGFEGYHLTGWALHVLGALLLWRLLRRLGVRHAWWGGLLFAVHPLTVESVAWMSELKNTLSLPLLLCSLCAYLDDDGGGSPRKYLLSLGGFTAALLSKTSVVMLPFFLLLHAWWRRQRVGGRDWRRVAPFFALSLVFGLITVRFQFHRTMAGVRPVSAGGSRLFEEAGRAIAFYCEKALWPLGLLPIYPRWRPDPPWAAGWLPWLALALVGGGLWRRRDSWGRHALLGIGWFLLFLVPVLGFVPMYYSRIAATADHLVYVPLAGLTGLAAAGASAWYDRIGKRRWILGVCAAGLAALLAGASRRYDAIFRSESDLWSYTLERNPNAWLAHVNLGNELGDEGRMAEAIAHYETALRLEPDNPEVRSNLGGALARTGRLPEAIGQYERALARDPASAEIHNNFGSALARAGQVSRALAEYDRSLQIRPDSAETRVNFALALFEAGRPSEAVGQLGEAIRLRPDYASGRPDLAAACYDGGNALAKDSRLPDAVSAYALALRFKPDFPEAEANLGSALFGLGRLAEAARHFQNALRLRPGFADAHYDLGLVLRAQGRTAEAEAEFAVARRLGGAP